VPESSPAIRGVTAALLSLRIAYSVALLASPAKVAANRWLGSGSRAGLPDGSASATAALAGVSALLSAAVAGLLDE
jgi:hypothetical protein